MSDRTTDADREAAREWVKANLNAIFRPHADKRDIAAYIYASGLAAGRSGLTWTRADIVVFGREAARMTEAEERRFGNHPTSCRCEGCLKYAAYSEYKRVVGMWSSYLLRRPLTPPGDATRE